MAIWKPEVWWSLRVFNQSLTPDHFNVKWYFSNFILYFWVLTWHDSNQCHFLPGKGCLWFWQLQTSLLLALRWLDTMHILSFSTNQVMPLSVATADKFAEKLEVHILKTIHVLSFSTYQILSDDAFECGHCKQVCCLECIDLKQYMYQGTTLTFVATCPVGQVRFNFHLPHSNFHLPLK